MQLSNCPVGWGLPVLHSCYLMAIYTAGWPGPKFLLLTHLSFSLFMCGHTMVLLLRKWHEIWVLTEPKCVLRKSGTSQRLERELFGIQLISMAYGHIFCYCLLLFAKDWENIKCMFLTERGGKRGCADRIKAPFRGYMVFCSAAHYVSTYTRLSWTQWCLDLKMHNIGLHW